MSKILGRKIDNIRIKHDMSNLELSIRTGIPKDNIRGIISGELAISSKDIRLISKALNVSVDDILEQDCSEYNRCV